MQTSSLQNKYTMISLETENLDHKVSPLILCNETYNERKLIQSFWIFQKTSKLLL